MRCVLIVACLSGVVLGDPAPHKGIGREALLDSERSRYWQDERHYALVPWVDPLRGVIGHGNQHDISLQNKIIRDVYSPTYYQPTLVVDYRYLKNGRFYTRGLGGQVLILPIGVKDHGQNSYDRLLDHLKKEELAQMEAERESPYRRREEPNRGLPYGRREEERRPLWVPERVLERAREMAPEREEERNYEKLQAWRVATEVPEREMYGK